jgi:hypothetical protein
MGHKHVSGRMLGWITPLSKINIHPYIILYILYEKKSAIVITVLRLNLLNVAFRRS